MSYPTGNHPEDDQAIVLDIERETTNEDYTIELNKYERDEDGVLHKSAHKRVETRIKSRTVMLPKPPCK